MKIRTLLIIGSGTFLVLLAVVFWATLSLFGNKGDAEYINLAGRQRMLTQKVFNDALTYGTAPSRANRRRLDATVSLFETTHIGLLHGGRVATDLERTGFTRISGADDQRLVSKLDEVDAQWQTMHAAIRQLAEQAVRRAGARDRLGEIDPRVLVAMNEAVRRMADGNVEPIVIDLAGRQRMLSQKVAKEAYTYASRPTSATKARLELSAAVFRQTHRALISGGTAPRRLDNTEPVAVAEPTSDSVVEKLAETAVLWERQETAVAELVATTEAYHEAVDRLLEQTPKLLQAMDGAVNTAQEIADERTSSAITKVQLGALCVGLLLALASVVLAVRIGSSLRALQTAADEISEGTVNTPIAVSGPGEIRRLAEALERMRVSLERTVRILDDEAIE